MNTPLKITHFDLLEEDTPGFTLEVASYPAGEEPHYLEEPSLYGEVVIGNIVVPLGIFCDIAEYVMTATPLVPGDPREKFVASIRTLEVRFPEFPEGTSGGPRLIQTV